MVETISQNIRKARKEHKCNWCHGTIDKGEKYEYATNKFEGEIYVWKNHLKCHELADKLDMWMHGWDGLTDDEFYDCLQEYLQDNMWLEDDADMTVEGSLYKDEKFEDWIDNHTSSEMVDKALEIFWEKAKTI